MTNHFPCFVQQVYRYRNWWDVTWSTCWFQGPLWLCEIHQNYQARKGWWLTRHSLDIWTHKKKLSFIFLYSVGLLKVFFAFLYEKEEDLFNHTDHIIILFKRLNFTSPCYKKNKKDCGYNFLLFPFILTKVVNNAHWERYTDKACTNKTNIQKHSFWKWCQGPHLFLKHRLGATQEWLYIVQHPYLIPLSPKSHQSQFSPNKINT